MLKNCNFKKRKTLEIQQNLLSNTAKNCKLPYNKDLVFSNIILSMILVYHNIKISKEK